MILDTNFIIDFLKGQSNALNKIDLLVKKDIAFAITTPTIFELYSGLIFLDKSEDEREKIISLLKDQIILSLDKNSAEKAGIIDGNLLKKGLKIDAEDSMIAGIAESYGETILTRNVKHFSRIRGIKIETY